MVGPPEWNIPDGPCRQSQWLCCCTEAPADIRLRSVRVNVPPVLAGVPLVREAE